MTWRWPRAAIASCASPTACWSVTSACRQRLPRNDGPRNDGPRNEGPRNEGRSMNLALRLARREMRSGLGGFRLFIACLALGVAAIAAILSFSRAVEEGLRADAREILGGDVAVSLLYREATPDQIAWLGKQGEMTRWIDSRSMARPVKSDGHPALVQLKALEPAYPLYGAVELEGGGNLADLLAKRGGVWGAATEAAALQRMNVALGDRLKVGDAIVELRAIIAREPDRGVNAFASLGPRLMIPLAAIAESGLAQQ